MRTLHSASRRTTLRQGLHRWTNHTAHEPNQSTTSRKLCSGKLHLGHQAYQRALQLQKKKKANHWGEIPEYRRHRGSSFCSVKDITEEDLENVAITMQDKVYGKVLGNRCHQCWQKTFNTKTIWNQSCGDVKSVLWAVPAESLWGGCEDNIAGSKGRCPPCLGICICCSCGR